MAKVTIDSIRPVVGSVSRGNSVGRAAGGRSSRKLRLEIQCGIGKREPNLAVNIAKICKRVCRGSSGSRCGIRANEINRDACVNQ